MIRYVHNTFNQSHYSNILLTPERITPARHLDSLGSMLGCLNLRRQVSRMMNMKLIASVMSVL